MSDFACPIVCIKNLIKHPNADTLSITEVEGCPVIVRTEDFKIGDVAVYIPVESLIPEDRDWVRESCSHLKFKNGGHRVRAVRLRQVFSMGILVPVKGALYTDLDQVGGPACDVSRDLGITKYEEPEETVHVPQAPLSLAQRVFRAILRFFGIKRRVKPRPFPVYGVAHYRKSKSILQPGERVIVTEKIHGINFAAAYINRKLVVSSHNLIRPVEDGSVYWRAAREYLLKHVLYLMPNHAIYGEIYGPGIQNLGYGVPPGEISLRVFDIYDIAAKKFLDEEDFCFAVNSLHLTRVPVLYDGPYDPEKIEQLADGISTIRFAAHFREGIVIKPATYGARGHVALKLVGQEYLLRKNGTEHH